jgi:hypothetical protein
MQRSAIISFFDPRELGEIGGNEGQAVTTGIFDL